ncbi:MAG TPA: hypothetical protein VHA06_15525 [Candidatus Angelobacter sp.]|nr:hypothetical protein [Candidatus Angelobacter sp.]
MNESEPREELREQSMEWGCEFVKKLVIDAMRLNVGGTKLNIGGLRFAMSKLGVNAA